MSDTEPTDRRPLKTRDRMWAKALARTLAARGVNPNHISLASIGAASLAGLFFCLAGLPAASKLYLFFGAVFVQFRLLCNMLDGMVAMESGKQTPTGAFYNEFPDRVSDILILLGFGLAAGHTLYGLSLGSISASLALLTAYVRALGASMHGEQDFSGPMAKPHRMALITGVSIFSLLPMFSTWTYTLVIGGNWLLIFGAAYTVYRRSRNLLQKVEPK